MNRDDDFIEQLEDYLDTYEGVVPLPASVRDAVHARLPETRQVRGAGRPERMLDMVSRLSAPARWGIGIAAVLVVLVSAAALFPRGAAPGIAAAPTPTLAATASSAAVPSASPSASPSGGAVRLNSAVGGRSCGEGLGEFCMQAGTYRLSSDTWPRVISFEVPEGWFPYVPNAEAESVLVESGPSASQGSGWGHTFLRVGEVAKDPCDASAGRVPTPETTSVNGLIAAMRSWPDFAVSDPQPIEVDGYTGRLVTVASTRTETDCAVQSIWTTPGGTQIDAYPMVGVAGQPRSGTFRILDIDGTLVVIRTTDFDDPSPHELDQGVKPDPTRHAADQVELQGILDSIRIGS